LSDVAWTKRTEQSSQRIDNSYTRLTDLQIYCEDVKVNSKLNAAINLRALPEQPDLIDHAAILLRKNRFDFMLEAACSAAQKVVLEQIYFRLDADKFQQFTAMLDAPPSHNPGLAHLMAVTTPWATDKT
jgi:uncharacterized protein (DUF1778 family)